MTCCQNGVFIRHKSVCGCSHFRRPSEEFFWDCGCLQIMGVIGYVNFKNDCLCRFTTAKRRGSSMIVNFESIDVVRKLYFSCTDVAEVLKPLGEAGYAETTVEGVVVTKHVNER